MRLRHFLLLVFLFLSLGPLLLFRAWPHSEVLQGELDEVHERHLLLARNLAAALERYHRDLVTTFELFAVSDEKWTYTPSTRRVLDNLSFRHMCLVDAATGRVVDALAPISAPCPKTVPAQMMEGFRGIAASGSVAFGPVVEAPSGENVIHLVTRRGAQLVIGAIQTTYFRELGEAISFGVMGHAAIVDHTGRALSHPLPDWVAIRKDMSKISAVQRMLNRETGVETFYSPALKGDMIAGFTFVDPVGWGVMIPQPIEELYQRAADARRSSLIVLLIGTVFAFVLAAIVSLRVMRPLEEISQVSASIAEGKFLSPRPPTNTKLVPVELATLQKRFWAMVGRLRENMTTINGLAYVDQVTGLGNRTVLLKTLDNAMQHRTHGALLMIDLDGFKSVNDAHGHDAGDALLSEVGARLCALSQTAPLSAISLQDFGPETLFAAAQLQIARLGGDEFAIWLPNSNSLEPEHLAQDIVQDIGAMSRVGQAHISIAASVGVAHFPQHARDRTELIKAADLAMYDAKRAGKGRHRLFAPALRDALNAQLDLARAIETGLRDGQFIAYFQPQFSLPDREVTGFEALARWQHPERGLLEPASFIGAAQDIDALHQIDEAIFEHSIKELSALSDSGTPIKSLAVNISKERLLAPSFLAALERLPALPFELRFELVETMVLDRIEGRLAWTLDRVREYGHKLDLDDFGAANASVLGLMNVEPSHLKVDRNLIMGIAEGNVAERLVRSIVEMGHALDVPIIAEGAEDEATIARLEAMNCDFVQGFALAKPMSARDLNAFLLGYNQDAWRDAAG